MKGYLAKQKRISVRIHSEHHKYIITIGKSTLEYPKYSILELEIKIKYTYYSDMPVKIDQIFLK